NDTVVEMYEKPGYEIQGITSLGKRLIEDQEY
ncbi:GNAT family N-acetyltransferase, partial [Serratia marcescens]